MSKKREEILIVVAEDSPTQAENITYSIESLGYRVLCGSNGEEALKLIRDNIPALVISDIIMPVMDGYRLCKSIKTDPDLINIPVILLTSLADTEDVLKGLECGADNYIIKPYNEEQLAAKIDSILKDQDEDSEAKSKQEEIDILFEGKKYLLSSTRFRILNMLLSTYEGAVEKTRKLEETRNDLNDLRNSLEQKIIERTKDLQQEIHERQVIEQAIMKSEKKYRDLVENVMIGVFNLSDDGRILFANQGLTELINDRSEKGLLDSSFQTLCHHPHEFDKFLEMLYEAGHLLDFKMELIAKSGEVKTVIINAHQKKENISGILLNITEREKLLSQERRYQDELKIAKDQAEESDRLKSAFLSNMSHEIRTPLNAITGFSSLIAKTEPESENKKEFIRIINDNCEVLLNLINNILDIAKLEAGKIKLNIRNCQINKLLDNIYILYSGQLEKQKKANLSFNLVKAINDETFYIYTDAERLFQVLSNLIENAIKFTETGSIGFGYEVKNELLEFYVKDTGVGLSGEQQEIIFERFRKAEESKTKLYGGAGLGLAICRKLLQLMDGSIRVESSPGQGADFCFNIPLVPGVHEPEVTQADIIPVKEHSMKGKKILVAEDNHLNYLLIEAFLAGTAIKICWARDGQEAVDQCKSPGDFDMVLMDLRMPIMDGYQAVRDIRSFNKDLPVVAVTAYSLSEVKKNTEGDWFTDYLAKPVNQEKLLQMINQYVFRT